MATLDDDITAFLDAALGDATPTSDDLPFITLTYAQSLDARIAGKEGKQLRLSGKESMRMTHHLRARHDGILVGIGTVLSDDPQLNARGLPCPVAVADQPLPFVLDTSCRTPVSCKLIQNARNGIGKTPWIVASGPSKSVVERRQALEAVGVKVWETALPSDLASTFADFRRHMGIQRLMIEGGSSVITSCLYARRRDGRPLVDRLIVTVAPTLVGDDGVPVSRGTGKEASSSRVPGDDAALPDLTPDLTRVFGSDAVFVATPR